MPRASLNHYSHVSEPLLIDAAGEHAAIDDQYLAVYKTRRVRSQEDGGTGQLFNLAEAFHRRPQEEFAPALGFIQQLLIESRAKHARRNRIDANSMLRPFDGQRFCQ